MTNILSLDVSVYENPNDVVKILFGFDDPISIGRIIIDNPERGYKF